MFVAQQYLRFMGEDIDKYKVKKMRLFGQPADTGSDGKAATDIGKDVEVKELKQVGKEAKTVTQSQEETSP